MSDLFDLNTDDFLESNYTKSEKKVDPNIYAPHPDQSPNGVYKAVIRPVPYLKDKTKSKYKKYIAKLVHPVTGEWLYVDCPSTVGKPSILFSLELALKKLEVDEPAIVKEIKENFSRWYNYYSPVYIKKDPQREELEGAIKFLKFGYQINSLITNELEPDAEIFDVPKINPYHLLKGKDLLYVVKRKSKQWNDYSNCKFIDNVSPLVFKINDKEIAVNENPKVMELTQKFLLSSTPSIDDYLFTEWTDETYKKVATFIKAIVPYKEIIADILERTRDDKMRSLFTEDTTAPISNSPVTEDTTFSSDEEKDDVPWLKSTETDIHATEEAGEQLVEPAHTSSAPGDLDVEALLNEVDQ